MPGIRSQRRWRPSWLHLWLSPLWTVMRTSLKKRGPIARDSERKGRHDSDASPAVSDASKTSMLCARWLDRKHSSIRFLF